MTQNHPSMLAPRRAAQTDEERQGRNLSLILVGGLLLWSLGYVGWKLWLVDSLGDRLEGLEVSVQAPDSVQVEVAELSVDRHQGPGESAFFDMIVHLRVRRGRGDGPSLLRIDAALADEGKKGLMDLEPMMLANLQPGEDRVTKIVWSPVPKPVAERAHQLLIWAR